MTELDQRISDTLRNRAEGAVDTDRLTVRAITGGRALRRRRRVGAGVALGLVAVLGLGVPAGSGRLPWTSAEPSAVVVPPRAPTAATAAERPDLVGTDPGLLHFGIDPARAGYLGWEAGQGVESARLVVDGHRQVVIDLGRTPADVEQALHEGMSYGSRPDTDSELMTAADFDGTSRKVAPAGPGGDPGWILRWQPVAGLYARVTTVAPDDRDLRTVAGALRLDEAYRCAAPLRLTALPPDARLARCAVNLVDLPDSVDVLLTVLRGEDQRLDVRLEYHRELAGRRAEGNRTIGGRAGYLHPNGDELELLGLPGVKLAVRFGPPRQGFTEADAATVLGGAVPADDLTRPATWR
ncbi:hypothetical protein OG271_05525 [Micromonospora rifamycinica]|uniref:hypothetical protein n=1 Tax=Micromonospora rifamycinica TaxID=291594 RepID=UPI002E2BE210|nr:hypothetical protein [Micromonospora rifamycinica]